MNTTSDTSHGIAAGAASCPFHRGDAAPPVQPAPVEAWPPGPPVRFTGWSLLRHMSRDLLAAVREWQQAYGDVVHLRFWPEHQVLVTDPSLVRELLVEHHDQLIRWERGVDLFARLQGRSVLTSEGAPWRRKRQAMQAAFSPKSVQAQTAAMLAVIDRELARWPEAAEAWPVEQGFTRLSLAVIADQLFSADLGEQANAMAEAVHTVSVAANREFYWPVSWPTWVPWKRPQHRALRYLQHVIETQVKARLAAHRSRVVPGVEPDHRPANPPADRTADQLERLLALHRADPQAWPLRTVRDECMTAFLAGHETVAASLSWWAWCLASHPEAQQRAALEVRVALQGRVPSSADLAALPWLHQSLQEAMRLYPAAPVLMTRRSLAPITLGRWRLPARTLFLLPVQAMQQDPRWFPSPSAFQPERFGPGAPAIPRGAYLPFGAGPRVCLGQHLAMTEMLAVAARLLQRWQFGPVPGRAAPQPVLNVSLRPDQPLHLNLRPAG